MRFTEEQAERYQSIIDLLSPPDGTPTSTAKLVKELEWESDDVHEAVQDLIAFGELELVNASQHGRVRLRQPVPSTNEQLTLADSNRSIWHAYVTEQDGLGRTRARRLFDNREAAEEHLKQITNIETLTAIPGVTNVWCATIGSQGYNPEYAILRSEPVFEQADNPYPK